MIDWLLYPSAWFMAVAAIVLALSFLIRARYAATWGGRLSFFLVIPLVWLAAVYVMSELRIDGLSNPAVLALAVRLALLSLFVLQAIINFIVSYQEVRIRQLLDRRLPGWRSALV